MRYVYGAGGGAGLRAHIVREDGGRTESSRAWFPPERGRFRALCSGDFGVGPTDGPEAKVCEKCERIRVKWVADAQAILATYSIGRPRVAWCAGCGDEIKRTHVREFNYCDKPDCKREQQRRNQANWRAKKRAAVK